MLDGMSLSAPYLHSINVVDVSGLPPIPSPRPRRNPCDESGDIGRMSEEDMIRAEIRVFGEPLL